MSQISPSQDQNEHKDNKSSLDAYYTQKPFSIKLQNEDIVRIHSLQNNNVLYLNGIIGKINGFVKEKNRLQVRIYDNIQDGGRTISIKEENLRPIFIQSLLPPHGSAYCVGCGTKFRQPPGQYIDNTCSGCLAPTFCGNSSCRDMYLFKHKLLGDGFACKLYNKYSDYEIDATINYSLHTTFEFNGLTTQDHTTLDQFKSLFKNGQSLTHNGIWKRFCCCDETPFGELLQTVTTVNETTNDKNNTIDPFWYFPNNQNDKNLIPSFEPILSQSVTSNSDAATKQQCAVKGWLDYYRIRNLSLKSPIAHFMSWPMTVYYALNNYINLSKLFDENNHKNNKKNEHTIAIHAVGCEKELDMLPLFQELVYLFPQYKFHFFMFGCDSNVSEKFKKNGFERISYCDDRLIFDIVKMVYSEENINGIFNNPLVSQFKIPHLVVGFNAGFEGYPQWADVIMQIKKYKIPSVFTEFASPTCENAKQLANQYGVKLSVQLQVNPFRSCFVEWCHGSRFTSVKNGWLYAINASQSCE